MEHLIIALINFILWLDRRSIRPLEKVVSNLDDLRGNPEAVLAREEIVIGPMRRWASGIALGLLTFVGGAALSLLMVFVLFIGKRGPGAQPGKVAVILGLFLLGFLGLGVSVFVRRMQGGRLVLREEGVELSHRGTRIHCPWALFNTVGNPFQPKQDRILLPVAPAAVSHVQAFRDEHVLSQGSNVKTRIFRFKTGNLVSLKAVFEANLAEMADLLLHLGRQLGTDLPQNSVGLLESAPVLEATPTVVRQKNGWLKVSLVHLSFPPYCCGCGCSTAELKEYHAYTGSGEFALVAIPLCTFCRKKHERSMHKSLLIGFFGGGVGGFWLALVVRAMFPRLKLLPLALILTIVGVIVGLLVGAIWGKHKSAPVNLLGYSPAEGTVQLWFRNHTYAEALLELLQGKDEQPPPQQKDETEDAYLER